MTRWIPFLINLLLIATLPSQAQENANEPSGLDSRPTEETNPMSEAETLVASGQSHLDLAEWDEAVSDLSEAIKRQPDLATAYYFRGVAYNGKGNHKAAIEDLSVAIKEEPSSDAYYQRGLAERRVGAKDEALKDISQAIELSPEHLMARLERAEVLGSKGSFDEALADLDAAHELDDQNETVYWERAMLFNRRKEYDRAIAEGEHLLEINPTYKPAFSALGVAHSFLGHDDQAIEYFTKAIQFDQQWQEEHSPWPEALRREIEKDWANDYADRAMAYEAKNDLSSAISDLTEAIRHKVDDPEFYRFRGDFFKRTNQFNKAIADLTKALELDPRDARTYRNRAYCHNESGEYDKGLADSDAALMVDSKFEPALETRGYAHLRRKEYGKAVADFTEAIALDPKSSYVFNQRGRAFSEQEKLERAVADFTEAIRLDPEDPAPLFYRSLVFTKQKKYDKTRADLKRITEIDAKADYALNSLAWLLATCPDQKIRDAKQAIETAQAACDLTNWGDAAYIDTLAAANAEHGDFEMAAKLQQQVLDMIGGADDRRAGMKSRLALFKNKQAYRTSSATTP